MLRFIHRHYRSCVVLVSLVWFGCYFAFDLGLAALALLDCGCLALLFVLASLYLRRVTRTYSEACDPEPYLELGLWCTAVSERPDSPWEKGFGDLPPLRCFCSFCSGPV